MKKIEMLNLAREYNDYGEEIDFAIKNCLQHQLWVNGPEVNQLEREVSQYLGVNHCLGVSSGTDALVLSLRALAIKLKGKEYFGREDEIITSAFTFSATGEAILRSGATPVFVDIDPHTFNLDSSKVLDYLENGNSGKVVGIVPVHLYGQSCEIERLMKYSRQFGLFIVEDTAQAFGGKFKEIKLGSFGNTGAFSFYPTKNLGCYGNGGMISTNDDEIAELIRMLREHGGKNKYDVSHMGYNSRLDTLQAAVLIAKLKFIDLLNEKRRKIADIYYSELSKVEYLTLPKIVNRDATHVFHQYTIMCKERDNLQLFLSQNGIASTIYYPVPLHQMKLFAPYIKNPDDLKNSELASKQVLSIPIVPTLNEDEILYTVSILKKFKN